jgi:hypothetical protein
LSFDCSQVIVQVVPALVTWSEPPMKLGVAADTAVTPAASLAETVPGLDSGTGSGADALTFSAVPSTFVKAALLAGVNKAGKVTGGMTMGDVHQQRHKLPINSPYGSLSKSFTPIWAFIAKQARLIAFAKAFTLGWGSVLHNRFSR